MMQCYPVSSYRATVAMIKPGFGGLWTMLTAKRSWKCFALGLHPPKVSTVWVGIGLGSSLGAVFVSLTNKVPKT